MDAGSPLCALSGLPDLSHASADPVAVVCSVDAATVSARRTPLDKRGGYGNSSHHHSIGAAMKYLAILLLALSTSAFSQDFASQVAAAKVNQQLINDLWSALQSVRSQLVLVQSANAQLMKDLSDAQAKVASCKAF